MTDESCAAIRKAAQNVTPEQIRNSVRKQTAAQPLSSDAFDLKCLETAESYDWMNAMNYINEHLQDTELDISFVKELNRRLGRLSTVHAGRFRQVPLQWFLRQLDRTETMFYYYINRDKSTLNLFRELEKGTERGKKVCESTAAIMNDQDGYLRVRDHHISTQSFKELLNAINHLDTVVIDQETYQPYKLDIHAPETWELQERDTNPGYKVGTIDIDHWFDGRGMVSACLGK